MQLTPNPEKKLTVVFDGKEYMRIPVGTPVIKYGDSLEEIVTEAVMPVLREGDVLFISEKAVACTQKGRAIPLGEIKPRRLAVKLSGYVTKTPAGIGLGMPETMEMALRECGVLRILFAAFVGAIGKLLGKKGWFYKIAGKKAAGIDGPCHYTLPPYNGYVVLTPTDPDGVSEKLKAAILAKTGKDIPAVIIDANDFGIEILGRSAGAPAEAVLKQLLCDNPLGQSDEQTPVGLIREKKTVQVSE